MRFWIIPYVIIHNRKTEQIILVTIHDTTAMLIKCEKQVLILILVFSNVIKYNKLSINNMIHFPILILNA